MESRLTPAEEFPALYRAILEGVSHLERIGERHEAGVIRTAASRAYMVWDDAGRRRLIGLQRRLERSLDGAKSAETSSVGAEHSGRVTAIT
jgi:hypothetical protein